MQDVGVQENKMGVRMGENTIVNNRLENLENEFLGFENQSKDDIVGNMEYADHGQKILNDPKLLEMVLNSQRKKITGDENMNDTAKKKFDGGVLQTMQQHPVATGKMFSDMKPQDNGREKTSAKTKMA